MKEYYWDEFHGVNNTAIGRYLTGRELDFIENFLDRHAVKDCLELGCGSGRLSVPVYRKYKFNITGVDIDPVPLKLLNERQPKIKTKKADLSQPLPFADNSFDFILAIEFLDYLTDLDAFFQECHRVLKPHGHILFTSGNAQSYKSWLQKRFGRHQGRYLFNTRDITNSLGRAGFEIGQIKGYNWLPLRRESNSFLVPLFSHIETSLGLEKIPNISPWIISWARRK